MDDLGSRLIAARDEAGAKRQRATLLEAEARALRSDADEIERIAEQSRYQGPVERMPGIDPKTGDYSTAQMLRDEMGMGDTSQPLFD